MRRVSLCYSRPVIICVNAFQSFLHDSFDRLGLGVQEDPLVPDPGLQFEGLIQRLNISVRLTSSAGPRRSMVEFCSSYNREMIILPSPNYAEGSFSY